MNGKRAHIADIDDVVEQLQPVHKGLAGGKAVLQLEPDKPAIAAPQIGMGPPRRVTVLKLRIFHLGDSGICGEEIGYRLGVLHMLPDPERQRFQPLNDLEGIDRAERPAKIAKQRHPRLQRIGGGVERGRRLGPDHPVVGGVRRVQRPLLLRMRRPVEIAAIDDHTADRGAVPADIFGQPMTDNGRAMFERPCQDRRRRFVDDQRDSAFTPNSSHLGEWKHRELRVQRCLGSMGAGVRVACLGEFSGRDGSTNRTSIPYWRSVFWNRFQVPPYRSVELTILFPALARF